MTDAAAGHVSAALATEGSGLALLRAGKLRALATSGVDRSPHSPQAPTFDELGLKRLTQREWFGAFMPRNTPAVMVSAAHQIIDAATREPGVRDAWQAMAMTAESSLPAELQSALRAEYEFWGPIIRASGFTPEA